jgi:metallophosphoesterase (TIGR00282 family)
MTASRRTESDTDPPVGGVFVRVLFIGDIVGGPGRRMVSLVVPRLVHRLGLDLVVANAENVAGGSGITVGTYEELMDAGIDAITLGDHAYRKDEVHVLFERSDRICRPANYPIDAPGPGSVLVTARDGTPVGIFGVLGRAFMAPVDCPLRTCDRLIASLRQATPVILVDAHAEATSEKQLIARYVDGRVSALLGTHTHVPTADEQVLAGGTAYQTDVGMTGPYDSVIGRRYDRVLKNALTSLPQHFEVATGDGRLAGTLVQIDPHSGRALNVARIMVDRPQADRLMRDPRADVLSPPNHWDDQHGPFIPEAT